MPTQSECLRAQGNEFYKQAGDQSLGTSLRKVRYENALKLYNQSLSVATTNDERASACKNLAYVSWNLGSLTVDDSGREALYHFKECMLSCKQAMDAGESCKDSDWLKKIDDLWVECYEKADELLFRNNQKEKGVLAEETKTFNDITRLAPTHIVEGNTHYKLAEKYFKKAVCDQEEGLYHSSLHPLDECYTPLELAEACLDRCRDKGALKIEIEDLKEKVYIHKCIAKSRQLINTGLAKFNMLLNDSESLNMDMAWETADTFRHAIIEARENDLESEAMALSHLGVLYDKVMKYKFLSKPCFQRCIELALSLQPREFSTADWYKVAAETLERYQQDLLANDIKAQEEEHAKHLEGMKMEMEKLKEAWDKLPDSSPQKRLYNLYKSFPPRNSSHRLLEEDSSKLEHEKCTSSELKKLCKKAMLHYSADRVTDCLKWKACYTEISKRLGSQWEVVKAGDTQ